MLFPYMRSFVIGIGGSKLLLKRPVCVCVCGRPRHTLEDRVLGHVWKRWWREMGRV